MSKRYNVFFVSLLAISFFFGCGKVALTSSTEIAGTEASSADAANGQATAEKGFVDGAYIVVFNDDISDVDGEVNNIARSQGIRANYTYRHVIKGFAAKLPPAALTALKNNPRVRRIEQDQYAQTVPTQSPATWGLDRVDQVNRPPSGSYN